MQVQPLPHLRREPRSPLFSASPHLLGTLPSPPHPIFPLLPSLGWASVHFLPRFVVPFALSLVHMSVTAVRTANKPKQTKQPTGGGEAKETLTHRREEVTPKKRHRPLSSAPPPTTRLFVFIYLFILFLFILLVVAFESLPLLVVHAVPERRGQKAALFFFLPLYPVLLYPILILLRLLLLGVCTRALNLRLSFSLYSVWLFLWCFSSFLHSPCRSVGFFL